MFETNHRPRRQASKQETNNKGLKKGFYAINGDTWQANDNEYVVEEMNFSNLYKNRKSIYVKEEMIIS